MKELLWAERVKLKRSKIIRIAVFTAAMVAFIVYLQGQFTYYDKRYIDDATWYMTAVQSLGSLYAFPAVIALMGSYMVCREEQDDTLKSLLLIPVRISDLIRAKLVVTAFFSVVLYVFLFAVAFAVEAVLHLPLLDLGMFFRFLKLYILEGIGLFLAVSPVVAVVYRLKKNYWIAFVFAEIFSFIGVFIESPVIRSVYPVTAAFCAAGYYETTPWLYVLSLLTLCACGVLSLLILRVLNKKSDIA